MKALTLDNRCYACDKETILLKNQFVYRCLHCIDVNKIQYQAWFLCEDCEQEALFSHRPDHSFVRFYNEDNKGFFTLQTSRGDAFQTKMDQMHDCVCRDCSNRIQGIRFVRIDEKINSNEVNICENCIFKYHHDKDFAWIKVRCLFNQLKFSSKIEESDIKENESEENFILKLENIRKENNHSGSDYKSHKRKK